jgi:hypothetical protein
MDYETFIVEMTKALAWPASAIALAVIFRLQVTKLLERLEHLKAPGVEADFQKKVAEVARSLPPEAQQQVGAAMEARSQVNPKAPPEEIIFDAWRQLEDRLQAIAVAKEMGDGRGRFREPLTIASKLTLPPGTFGTIKQLHTIRNEVVHAKSVAPLTLDTALEYVGLVAEVTQTLPQVSAEHRRA